MVISQLSTKLTKTKLLEVLLHHLNENRYERIWRQEIQERLLTTLSEFHRQIKECINQLENEAVKR
jgi:hypothetical protein